MSIVFISYLHRIPICDEKIMIIYSVVPEILVLPPPRFHKAEANSCFVYGFFTSEKLWAYYESNHSPPKPISFSTELHLNFSSYYIMSMKLVSLLVTLRI